MEVNTIPNYNFSEQYRIYGYQNDRYDPPSHQKKIEQDRMKNKRATAKNVPPRADPIFWQDWPQKFYDIGPIFVLYQLTHNDTL